ncbi:helix-turn-helix transcriptional regulator [Natronoglycomyces albus]|uniref:Helix-turn-helix transcriptional regulator n=2 Tax=Natronoglycomyces albus TaxID=2811108 RepID=A0A895XVG0_9ACTN|nr:helix-turn-helix transcriptional regulator [Natronoglycomyces albus]QSB05628.1 helix-turn-helix transcriptional regulator [Natronoglycomyces albus]
MSSEMAPPIDDDKVFKALASATRRRILDQLKDHPKTTGEVCAAVDDLDRCTVMQHLRVLEQAGLVIPQRKGRERWNHLSVLPIKHIYDRWISEYASPAVEVLSRLESDLNQ